MRANAQACTVLARSFASLRANAQAFVAGCLLGICDACLLSRVRSDANRYERSANGCAGGAPRGAWVW